MWWLRLTPRPLALHPSPRAAAAVSSHGSRGPIFRQSSLPRCRWQLWCRNKLCLLKTGETIMKLRTLHNHYHYYSVGHKAITCLSILWSSGNIYFSMSSTKKRSNFHYFSCFLQDVQSPVIKTTIGHLGQTIGRQWASHRQRERGERASDSRLQYIYSVVAHQ